MTKMLVRVIGVAVLAAALTGCTWPWSSSTATTTTDTTTTEQILVPPTYSSPPMYESPAPAVQAQTTDQVVSDENKLLQTVNQGSANVDTGLNDKAITVN